MNKLYKNQDDIDKRISQFKQADEDEQNPNKTISYSELFCSPKYRRATLVGIFLAIFNSTTGIDVFMMYSNTVFKKAGLSATTITGLVGVVNFVTTLIGMTLLNYFGRRPIMLYGHAVMSLLLILSGIFSLK